VIDLRCLGAERSAHPAHQPEHTKDAAATMVFVSWRDNQAADSAGGSYLHVLDFAIEK
jgi:hypothetical protein